MSIDSSYWTTPASQGGALGGFTLPQNDPMVWNNDPLGNPLGDPINDPLAQALDPAAGINLGGGINPGGAGLAAAIGGAGGMDLGQVMGDDPSSYWGDWEGTGFNIASSDIGDTPMGLPDQPYDNPYGDPTPYDIPIVYDPMPYDTPTELPPIYNPPTNTPTTDIDTSSYTPPATPGQIPQFSMPNFAFNFPMPNINPLVGGPNMGPVGFYSVNSGAAGLPVPAYEGIENPNMLSNYVQQFVGGPDVLTRSLIG